MFIYLFMLIFPLNSSLFALEIDETTPYKRLLNDATIYIDHTQSETIQNIQTKEFKAKNESFWGFSYSPKFDVWIKITLKNNSNKTIEKVIEYDNPLTSYVDFYEGELLIKKDGLLAVAKERNTLNPIVNIRLNPHESKVFFIRASSKVTTLIVDLKLWNKKAFEHKEKKHQLILTLFFGAMGIIIVYNFIIFLATRELSYFYYVLFFTSVSFHHFMYKGVAALFIPSDIMQILIHNASFIVAMPMLFLALFVQKILILKQYPKLDKLLNSLLVLYISVVVLVMVTNQHQYRSLFLVFMLLTLFYIAFYALIKKNQQAKFIIVGLGFLISSGLFMYLSSAGIYDVFNDYPYYTEFSLVVEISIFSLALASKIKMLREEKAKSEQRALLLRDLNHRVQNSTQIILSFLILQRDEVNDRRTEEILTSLESRILATSELYTLLEAKDEMSIVDMREYFLLIINNIQKSFKDKEVVIEVHSNIKMRSQYAIHCGLLVNEAVTNAFKHAFHDLKDAKIVIELYEKENSYYLNIKDNGSGFKKNFSDSLGMDIMETLATIQLEGTFNIEERNGTDVVIEWGKNDR